MQDHTILEGRRGKDAQNAAYARGASKVKWPNGDHNVEEENELVMAVDATPFPIRWPKDAKSPQDRMYRVVRFYYFAGIVKAIALQFGVEIRWGGDWDSDNIFWNDILHKPDQDFNDLVHFEIAGM